MTTALYAGRGDSPIAAFNQTLGVMGDGGIANGCGCRAQTSRFAKLSFEHSAGETLAIGCHAATAARSARPPSARDRRGPIGLSASSA